MRRPRPKFKISFYLYFCWFWINVTQINFENNKRKIQRFISDNCFQLKSWFNVDARAPSIPLLNSPFKSTCQTKLYSAVFRGVNSHKPIGFLLFDLLSFLHKNWDKSYMSTICLCRVGQRKIIIIDISDNKFSFQNILQSWFYLYHKVRTCTLAPPTDTADRPELLQSPPVDERICT